MIKLKVHNKPLNESTSIDKYILVPKKLWEDFNCPELELRLNGKKTKLRTYEIPCQCVGKQHTHKIIDLREIWDEMKLSGSSIVEIEK